MLLLQKNEILGMAVASGGVLGVLLISELLWRTKHVRGENARKFVHILVGSFVATWPYFLSWRQIQLMSLAFLLVVVASQQYHVFHAVHGVKRRTWGEVFFALGIGLTAFLMPPPIIFVAAILHLSLADGLAALVGKRYGLLHQYKIGNYSKTLAGSWTFWLTSTVIVTATVVLSPQGLSLTLLPMLAWLPLTATVVENIGVGGIDNLLVPLFITVVLQAAHVA